ncbi:MAG: Mur ligase family protein [Bacilli bacterium]
MRLSHVVQSLVKYHRIGSEDPEIMYLTADSRQVRSGSLFVAIRGCTVDGHAFTEDAVKNGAMALMVDTELAQLSVPQIVVSDTRKASGILATQFYGDPSSRLAVIGVTGTQFHIGVFTNLTQDHLDFHGTMENYRRAKGKLFSRLGNAYGKDRWSTACAVLNADDDATALYRRETVMEYVTYGIREPADVRAVDIRVEADGARFHVTTFAGETDVKLRLTGRFNVYNALAALSVGLVEGIDLSRMALALEAVSGIPGRLDRIELGQPFTVLIDYAHTPDGLWNVLTAIREWANGRVITVVGSGGNRDRGKRPKMAHVAVDGSDVAILTGFRLTIGKKLPQPSVRDSRNDGREMDMKKG